MIWTQEHCTTYQLRVDGHLDEHWSTWFGHVALIHETGGTTSITGVMADQAQLHGLLTRIRDLGVTLISVAVVEPPPGAAPAELAGPRYRPGPEAENTS